MKYLRIVFFLSLALRVKLCGQIQLAVDVLDAVVVADEGEVLGALAPLVAAAVPESVFAATVVPASAVAGAVPELPAPPRKSVTYQPVPFN